MTSKEVLMWPKNLGGKLPASLWPEVLKTLEQGIEEAARAAFAREQQAAFLTEGNPIHDAQAAHAWQQGQANLDQKLRGLHETAQKAEQAAVEAQKLLDETAALLADWSSRSAQIQRRLAGDSPI
jgi:hypothetical protein